MTIAFALVSICAAAQEPFALNKAGTVVEYVTKNAKGKVQSYMKTTVDDVKMTDEKNFSVTQTLEMFDKDRKPTMDPMTMTTEVKDGKVDLSPFTSMPGMENVNIEIEGEMPSLPSDIYVGQVMDFAFKMKVEGITASTEGKTTVVARESITTPAGTFDCYKTEGEVTVKMIFTMHTKSVSWDAPGIGTVRSETYNKNGKLETIQELISITR